MNAKTISAFVVVAACVVSFGIANLWFSSKSAEANAAEQRDRVLKLESRLAADVDRRRAELATELKAKITDVESKTTLKLEAIHDAEKETRAALASLAGEHGAAVGSSGKATDRLSRTVAGIDDRVMSVDRKVDDVERRFTERITALVTEITRLRALQEEARDAVAALSPAESRPSGTDAPPNKPTPTPSKPTASPKKGSEKAPSDKSNSKESRR